MKEKAMEIKTGSGHITRADGNIFLDLGFPPEEAKKMLEKADRDVLESRRKRLEQANQPAHQ